MLTYLRYALATICFALSVACLGLWWRSGTHHFGVQRQGAATTATMTFYRGYVNVFRFDEARPASKYVLLNQPRNEMLDWGTDHRVWLVGQFGVVNSIWHGPIWYVALVFALAGIGALRLGRRFTLRSAIIATTVVAALLGMVVAL